MNSKRLLLVLVSAAAIGVAIYWVLVSYWQNPQALLFRGVITDPRTMLMIVGLVVLIVGKLRLTRSVVLAGKKARWYGLTLLLSAIPITWIVGGLIAAATAGSGLSHPLWLGVIYYSLLIAYLVLLALLFQHGQASAILQLLFGLIGSGLFGFFGLLAAGLGQAHGAEAVFYVAHLAIGGAVLGTAVGALLSLNDSQLHPRFWVLLAPAIAWSVFFFSTIFLDLKLGDSIFTYGGLGLLGVGGLIGTALSAKCRPIQRRSPVFLAIGVVLLLLVVVFVAKL